MAILFLLICAATGLGIAGQMALAASPRPGRRPVAVRLRRLAWAHTVLCGAGLAGALWMLLTGPVQMPGIPVPAALLDLLTIRLGMDGLSAALSIPAFCALGLAGAAGIDRPDIDSARLPFVTAATLLTITAADISTLAGGFALLFVALWACPGVSGAQSSAASEGRSAPGPAWPGDAAAIAAVPLLIVATMALMKNTAPGPAMILLAMTAVAVFYALRPARAVLESRMDPRAAPDRRPSLPAGLEHSLTQGGPPILPVQRDAPPALPAPSLLARPALQTILPLYLLGRLGLDMLRNAGSLSGTVPVMAAGVVLALLGGLQALRGQTLRLCVAGMADTQAGIAILGSGVAMAAMGVDLAGLASLSMAAVLITASSAALLMPVLGMGTALIEEGAGSSRLDRLGGVAIGMPATALAMSCACLGSTMLPPSPIFASRWLLIQALIGAQRIQDPWLEAMLTVSLIAAALTAGLVLAAMLRLLGLAILGRPRSPRAAASGEPRRPVTVHAIRAGLLVTLCIGLFPGPFLRAMRAALMVLCGNALDDRTGWLTLAAQLDGPLGYTPAVIAIGLAGGTAALMLAVRGRLPGMRACQPQEAPAWNDGDSPPPPWLPFGDPATQPDPVSAADIVLIPFSAGCPPARRRLQAALARCSWLAAWLAQRGAACTAPAPAFWLLLIAAIALGLAGWEERP